MNLTDYFNSIKVFQEALRSSDKNYDKKVKEAQGAMRKARDYDTFCDAFFEVQKLTRPNPMTFKEVFPDHIKGTSKGLVQDWSHERELLIK